MTTTIGGSVGGTPLELDAEAEELEGAPLEAIVVALEDEKLGGALVAVLELAVGPEDDETLTKEDELATDKTVSTVPGRRGFKKPFAFVTPMEYPAS